MFNFAVLSCALASSAAKSISPKSVSTSAFFKRWPLLEEFLNIYSLNDMTLIFFSIDDLHNGDEKLLLQPRSIRGTAGDEKVPVCLVLLVPMPIQCKQFVMYQRCDKMDILARKQLVSER